LHILLEVMTMARPVTFGAKADPWATYAKEESRAKKTLAKRKGSSGKGGAKRGGKGGGS
jgi:hypothetical protein